MPRAQTLQPKASKHCPIRDGLQAFLHRRILHSSATSAPCRNALCHCLRRPSAQGRWPARGGRQLRAMPRVEFATGTRRAVALGCGLIPSAGWRMERNMGEFGGYCTCRRNSQVPLCFCGNRTNGEVAARSADGGVIRPIQPPSSLAVRPAGAESQFIHHRPFIPPSPRAGAIRPQRTPPLPQSLLSLPAPAFGSGETARERGVSSGQCHAWNS